MAKRREDIENPMVVIPLKRPVIHPRHVCENEMCNDPIYKSFDSYLEIDDMMFCSDRCAADHYIKEAGGRRVHGGAC